MLAPKNIDERYNRWNERWHAPSGHTILKRFVPRRCRYNRVLGNLVGIFGFQPNNNTRIFEYPWAFYATDLKENMTVLDLGGGFSGFPFVLNKLGMKVINVDPFFQYGPTDHYKVDPHQIIQKMNRIFGTSVSLKRCVLDEAKLADESVDRIFCISVIEHMSLRQAKVTLEEAHRLLRPGGLCILTIDLFLNLQPFTDRQENEYGRNIPVRELLDDTTFKLVAGKREELFGHEEFNAQDILRNLEKYFIGDHYPTLVQTIVLKKTHENGKRKHK